MPYAHHWGRWQPQRVDQWQQIYQTIIARPWLDGCDRRLRQVRGIDAACHTDAHSPGTIDVLAGGPEIVYPQGSVGLYESIFKCGLVVSEQQPGVEPITRKFPHQNRIISGLSLCVVVVETATQPGSSITAHLPGEQGPGIFAVSGLPLDPRAKEPNKLIFHDTILLASAEDVLAVCPLCSATLLAKTGNRHMTPHCARQCLWTKNFDPRPRCHQLMFGVNAVAD